MSVIICAINCGLIILISINLLFSYIPLFFITFIIFIIIIIIPIFAVQRSGTHLVVALLWNSEMCFSFCSFNMFIIVLCCFIPLGSTGCLVCDTAFGMQHTKFLGGMCYLVIFGWYLGHLESPITLGYMFGFNVNISYLYSVKPQIIVL